MQAAITDVDPFDLPEWLGTREVVWRAEAGLSTGHHVRGRAALVGLLQGGAEAVEVGHHTAPFRRKSAGERVTRSLVSARALRLFTVPTATPSSAATSFSLRSK